MVTPEMIHQTRLTLHKLLLTKWLAEDVFSLRWWGMVAFIALSYIVCLKLLDKRRLSNILLFGSLLTVGMAAAETIGVSFVLWFCATPILPIIPCIFAADYTIIPLYYMLVYQFTSTWKQFALWNAIAAGIFAFIFQPIVVHFKIFELDRWSYVYTFAIVLFIASLARAVTLGILAVEEKRS